MSYFAKLKAWWKQQEDPLPVYAPPAPPVVRDEKLERLIAVRAATEKRAHELFAQIEAGNKRLVEFRVNQAFRWMGVPMHVYSVVTGSVLLPPSEEELRLLYQRLTRGGIRPEFTMNPWRRAIWSAIPPESIEPFHQLPVVRLTYFTEAKGLCGYEVESPDFDALLASELKP